MEAQSIYYAIAILLVNACLVVAGPDGVWDLAERHLPEALRPVLREARLADSLCAGR